MAVIQISKIQVRRGQESQTGIPQLEAGEFGWAQDTENLYIGKRIEEGASNDDNTRVLTENDLNNIFLFIGQAYTTATVNTVYRYRGTDLTYTTTSTLQRKLDSFNPSLTDFGIVATTNTYVQLDVTLQNAINEIFDNIDPGVRQERRRVLEVPAGRFYLSNTVTLPPYTKLVGAGSGLTKIKFTNSLTSMFKTVDADGNTFEAGNMSLSTGSARDVVLEGMTLEFSNSLSGAVSLLSLDNVTDALVKDVTFQTEFNADSTTTYGIVNYGVGVQIRGQGDNGTEKCRNVVLEQCKFNGLKTGVEATGTVVTPAIRNSIFSNLRQGIVFRTDDTLNGPVNGYIAYNRFQDILLEGIYVSANPNNRNGSLLSTQNYFARVGGLAFNEFTTASSTLTSVLFFGSAGNKTVDDYFARRENAPNYVNSATFYYAPFVKGTTTIADSAVYSTTVIAPSTTAYAYIPLNESNQAARINYQLYNASYSRKGTILANISPSGSVAITDTYNYIESLAEDLGFISASTGSGVNLLVVSTSTYPRFQTVSEQIGKWYLTGSPYPGKSAFITSVSQVGNNYLVGTDSDSPVFDFSSTGTYTLLVAVENEVSASYDTTFAASQNFVAFTMQNQSTQTSYTLDYQLDLQI